MLEGPKIAIDARRQFAVLGRLDEDALRALASGDVIEGEAVEERTRCRTPGEFSGRATCRGRPARSCRAGRRHLADFLGLLLPSYQRTPHTEALCAALEALEARETRRLIISMPPRHGKTLHVSQAFPAWVLGRHPEAQIILASYAAELAEQNSRRARGFLLDPRWPFPGVSVSAGVGGGEQLAHDEGRRRHRGGRHGAA